MHEPNLSHRLPILQGSASPQLPILRIRIFIVKLPKSAPKSYTHCFRTARSHKMERIFTSQASRVVVFDQVHFNFAFSDGA